MDQLLDIKVGTETKNSTTTQWQKKKIHVLYAQLISQFSAENEHGEHDSGHESLRRQGYARHMLGEFAKELKAYRGTPDTFRSHVLTPVLQRYLAGVPDNYAPFVSSAIAGEHNKPTIADATEFYLARDPLDPKYIPFYRRSLLYIAESRWHLGILLGNLSIESKEDFNRIRTNNDNTMETISEPSIAVSEREAGDESPQKLDEVAIRTILSEGLEDFFEDELDEVVCALSPLVYFL